MGDELLLSALISNFTCEITKLPWPPSTSLSVKMVTKFQNFMNRCQGIKTRFGKPKHRKEYINFRRILTGILSRHSENSELKPNLSSKLLTAWRSTSSPLPKGSGNYYDRVPRKSF